MDIRCGMLIAVLAVTFLTGCGGDEKSDGPVPSMLSAPQAPPGAGIRRGANDAPIVDGVEIRPANPVPGHTVRAVASVSDADGDATRVRYVWRTAGGGRVLGEGRSFETRGFDEGARLEVVVTATDGEEDSAPYIHELRLAASSLEIAFVAIDSSEGTKPGSVLEAVVESTNEDVGGYEVLLEWEINGVVVGTGIELDTTRFSPGDTVLLKARFDFGDHATRPVTAHPLRLARGEAPVIVSEPRAGIEGGVFQYQIRATSSESGAQLSYELMSGPEGMTVGLSSGLVAWRPASDQRGAFEIEVAAKDQWGSGSAQAFRIQVDAPVSRPASLR